MCTSWSQPPISFFTPGCVDSHADIEHRRPPIVGESVAPKRKPAAAAAATAAIRPRPSRKKTRRRRRKSSSRPAATAMAMAAAAAAAAQTPRRRHAAACAVPHQTATVMTAMIATTTTTTRVARVGAVAVAPRRARRFAAGGILSTGFAMLAVARCRCWRVCPARCCSPLRYGWRAVGGGHMMAVDSP